MKKLRFGILGCSRIAESSVIPAIIQSSFSDLTIIGSRIEQKATDFAAKFSCPNSGTYDDVLNSDVDVIYISLPVGLHEEWAVKAAKHGKHILCEKSSTTSYHSARRMVDACKENKVRILEAFMFRFHPQHQKVLDLIQTKTLGDVSSFYGCYGLPSVSYDDIRHKKELGGGVLNDAACYPICASRIVFRDEPLSVNCYFDIDKKSQVETKVNMLMRYDKNRFASLFVGYDLYYQSVYVVWGNAGLLKLNRSYNIPFDMNATMLLSTNKTEEISITACNHYKLMIDAFCNEIMDIHTCNFNFENDLLNQAKAMEAARLSVNEQRSVLLSEIK